MTLKQVFGYYQVDYNVTTKDLAGIMGMHPATLSRMIDGKSPSDFTEGAIKALIGAGHGTLATKLIESQIKDYQRRIQELELLRAAANRPVSAAAE